MGRLAPLLPTPLVLLLLLLLAVIPPARAKLIAQTWRISRKLVAPDGVSKVVPVVNGLYPGPELRGRVGDRVRITVVNALATDTTSIHWHGVKQSGTPWSDGVPAITQCGIGPGETFVYDFMLDQPGTIWWHSHSGFQKSSLYGALIVEGDEEVIGSAYEERTLLLNDWFHESSIDQIEGILRPNFQFKFVGDAQSLLFNGKGDFDCNKTARECDPDAPDKGPEIIDVEPGKTYRVRVVGAMALSLVNLNIDDHWMQVVEAETTPLQPFRTRFLDVGPGQSLSFLLRAKTLDELAATPNNNGLFWMQINVRLEVTGARGLAILRYSKNTGEEKPKRPVPNALGRLNVKWSLKHARRFKALASSPLPKPDRRMVFVGAQNVLLDGRVVWTMNNISYVHADTPLLHTMALGLKEETEEFVSRTMPPTPYDYSKSLAEQGISMFGETGKHVVPVRKGEVVDMIFPNTLNLAGGPELHTWHLHMHNFWVLGFGDELDAWTEESEKKYDTTTAVSRNTFALYPTSWTAIRVKFDNPGMAHFHCHILSHLFMGMGLVMKVGETGDIPAAPQGTQFCGLVTKLMAPPVSNPLISGGCAA